MLNSPCMHPANVASPPSTSTMETAEVGNSKHETVVVVKGRIIHMRQADCKRASREGRPRKPSLYSRIAAREKVERVEREFIRQGRKLLTTIDYVPKQARTGSFYSSHKMKGCTPAPANSASKITHLQNLKSRTVDQFNIEPSYLLCERTAELQYDRLTESALRANAGSQAVTQRKATQGAANQTPYVLALLSLACLNNVFTFSYYFDCSQANQ